MGQIFYDHLITIHEVYGQIEAMDIKKSHKARIIETIEDILHHRVIHTILDHLPQNYHPTFLEKFHQKPDHPELLDFLKAHISDIDHKIRHVDLQVKQEIVTIIFYDERH